MGSQDNVVGEEAEADAAQLRVGARKSKGRWWYNLIERASQGSWSY